MKIGTATVESSMEIPQKIKNAPAFRSSYPTFGAICKGTQNTNSKEHKHSYVHCRIIYNQPDMEAAQVSISRWVYKTTMGYLHKRILVSYRICNSIDGPGEHYAKWNKPVREIQIPYDFIHMWNLMNKLK